MARKKKIPAIIGLTPAWEPGCYSRIWPDASSSLMPFNGHKHHSIDQQLFLNTIKGLEKNGCEIALHGYSHKVFHSSNILNINNFGEFAGISLEEQVKKILKGKKFFRENNLQCRMFMAPGHSYDYNTLLALKECDILWITDGKALFPFKESGLIFVPQITSAIKTKPLGIITICLHPQYLTNASFQQLKDFCDAKKNILISAQDAVDHLTTMGSLTKIINRLSQVAYMIRNALLKKSSKP
ncbi:MAG: DUF2334 domain-containing protein [Leadbetterella sp.]|nr:DUF2334 domain-containing protein [Leadbetterella sp.]